MQRSWLWAGMATLAISVTAHAEKAPKSVKGATTVDAAKVKKLADNGAVVVDVRAPKSWAEGRIPGAKNIDIKALTKDTLAEIAGPDVPVVFYCGGFK